MTTPGEITAAALLEPLTANQQRLVEVIAEACLSQAWRWPIFDYVEGTLELEGIDAWTELVGVPQHPISGYGVAWCQRAGNAKPPADAPVGLTVFGLDRAESVQQAAPRLVPMFFSLLRFLAEWRRARPPSPTEARKLRISSDEVIRELALRGISKNLLSPALLRGLLEHEPATWTGGASAADGKWERDVSREVYRFEHVETIESYVGETTAMFSQSVAPEPMAAPSPLGLVSAIDYLDTVWRLVPGHSDHLFGLHGAQRIALLVFPANTADEFDSRLSGLGELLQSVQLPADAPSAHRERDRPLGPLEAYIKTLLPDSQTRIGRAVDTLHRVIDVRDAGQHSAAGRKGAAALAELGAGYPPATWPFAWSVVSARTIEALEALREELATLTA